MNVTLFFDDKQLSNPIAKIGDISTDFVISEIPDTMVATFYDGIMMAFLGTCYIRFYPNSTFTLTDFVISYDVGVELVESRISRMKTFCTVAGHDRLYAIYHITQLVNMMIAYTQLQERVEQMQSAIIEKRFMLSDVLKSKFIYNP